MNQDRMKILLSFAYMNPHVLRVVKATQGHVDWLLDSGAFTAHQQGKEIDIKEYMKFLSEHGSLFWQTIGLDKVGDSKATKENLRIMRSEGFNPMPVLTVDEHANEAVELLGDNCKHLCVAGGVTVPVNLYAPRLSMIRSLVGDQAWLHGLGFSRGPVVANTAVDSVDSSTWLAGKRWGQLVWFDPSTSKGFGNIGWRDALQKNWSDLPVRARNVIVQMGLRKSDLNTHDMSKGAFSALSMQSVHAFLRFGKYLKDAGKVYFFAVTNVQDTVQLLIAKKHSTDRAVRWRNCKADVEKYRAGNLAIDQLAADAAANLKRRGL